MVRAFELQDEINNLQDIKNYDIPNEYDPSSQDVEVLLENAVESITEQSENIMQDEIFDIYRSFLKHSASISGTLMIKLLDSLLSGLQAQVEATSRDIDEGDSQSMAEHKMPLEMYAFLIQWFTIAAENVRPSEDDVLAASPVKPKPKRGKGGKAGAGKNARSMAAKKQSDSWTWDQLIPQMLSGLHKVLKLKLSRIWTTITERDTFVSCVTRPAYQISEKEQYMKVKEIKYSVFKIICTAVKNHGHANFALTNIMQNIQYEDHLAEPWAECLIILVKELDYTQLADELLRNIAGLSFSSQDNKSSRIVAKFLIFFAESVPRSAHKQMSLLLTQLDSEAYAMRNAIVEVIGFVIKDLSDAGDLNMERQQADSQVGGLIGVLIERMLDLSSYVRTKVLTVLARLCDMNNKYPAQRIDMTNAAIAALEDKVASVRKSAVALLVRLMLTNPYEEHKLKLSVWEGRYKDVKEELTKLQGTIGKAVDGQESDEEVGKIDEEENANEEGEDEDEDEDEDEGRKKKSRRVKKEDDMDVDDEELDGNGSDVTERADESTEKKKKKARKSQINIGAIQNEQEAVAGLNAHKYTQIKLMKRLVREALTFVRLLGDAAEIICKLLGSTHKAEVLESMDFFRVLAAFEFEGSKKGVKQMLHLIWSKDNASTSDDGKELKGIRQRLIECYRNLFFDPVAGMEPIQQVNRITKNMIELTYDASLAELTSLEEMMRTMMDEGEIHPDIISRLWAVYSSDRQLAKPQRRGAIIVLGMLALAKRGIITDKVDILLKTGLGTWGKADPMLARYTCVALQRLNGSAKKIKGSLEDKTIRMEMNNPVFQKIRAVIEQPCRSKDWFGLAEQAINTIYALGEHPDELCNEIVKTMTRNVFGSRKQAPAEEEDAMDEDLPANSPMSQDTPSATQQNNANGDCADAFELSKLLFIVGHVAIKQIVFLELVEREWKRQKDETTSAEKAQTAQNSSAKDGEELDQVAGNAEDEIGERIAAVRETELLYGENSLLAIYGPLIVHICGSPHKFKNATLRAAAILAFSKFLCVSSKFCDQHHHLLFRILETTKHPDIRSNIVIALGDVAVSFSTIIDENSNELYKGLSDNNIVVKKNTLMVLTHLILNGMIKVKGQLGEMAKCLEDPEPRISDLAKLFFSELSKKENAIYNNLPDVISHLSSGDHAVDEDTFQNTLRYIFKFIEKEKQAENIVQKLCERFRLSEDDRQWRDIAFCLSLLPFKSERSVKKLIEGLPHYQDKLHEETVFSLFTEILTKARANKSKDKPDTELDEFEQILENHKLQGEEDQALEKRAQRKKAKAAAKKRGTRQSARKKTQQTQPKNNDEE